MNLRGIVPPVATPFTANDDIDLDALRFNLSRWLTTRLRGFLLLGSNGEAAYVTDDEAERIVVAARECVPRNRVLLVGTGRDGTRATIAASVRAAAAGADAVLVRPPTAFRGQMSADALHQHFTAVADASRVPMLLYNFAAGFGIDLATDTMARLAEHPNIVGLKESGGNLTQIGEQVTRAPDRFVVVVGSAPTLYPSLCVGVTGGIVAAANVIPELMVDLYDATMRGDHAAALQLQRATTPLAAAVTTRWGVPALKAAMTLAGYRGGPPRSPLLPVSNADVDELRRMITGLPQPSGASHAAAARQ